MTRHDLSGLTHLSMSSRMTQARARICWHVHTHARPYAAGFWHENLKSALSSGQRDAQALDFARPCGAQTLSPAPSPALFNESMTTCTTLVHSTLGTYMHASFTQCIDPSGPMYASCAPAARGGRACGAEIFIIFHQHGQ